MVADELGDYLFNEMPTHLIYIPQMRAVGKSELFKLYRPGLFAPFAIQSQAGSQKTSAQNVDREATEMCHFLAPLAAPWRAYIRGHLR